MNRDQNAIFNALMSRSHSFLSGSEGSDVAIFTAEGDLEAALVAVGFVHDIRGDKHGQIFGETVWWHTGAELLVCNVPRSKTWTLGTVTGCVKSADMAPVTTEPETAMPYITSTIIAEFTTADSAQAARDRAAERFPEMAGRLAAEDTGEPWLNRESWGVALQNGSNAECSHLWNFLYDLQ